MKCCWKRGWAWQGPKFEAADRTPGYGLRENVGGVLAEVDGPRAGGNDML